MWVCRRLVKKRVEIAALITLAIPTLGNAQITVPGTLVEERRAAPGQTYGGIIGVTNASAKPQEARIYQTDYSPFPDGSSRYDDPGSTARSNARWVSVASRIVIPPGQSVDIPYNVAVPANLALAGTYWSIVMIEAVAPGSPESSLPAARPAEVRVGLVPVFRTAVQIVTDVGTQTTRAAKFETTKVQAVGDTSKVLQFDLRNTGDLGFRPAMTLELYSEDGTHISTQKATRGLTYPGVAVRQRFELGKLRPGRYRAIVTADLGEGMVIGARYSFAL